MSERSSILLMGRNTVVIGAVVITVASFAIGYFLGFKGGGSPEQEKQQQVAQNPKAGDLLPLEEKRVIDLPVKDVPSKPLAAQPAPAKQAEQVAEASAQKPAEPAASPDTKAKSSKKETKEANQPQAEASAPAEQAAKPAASTAKTGGHAAEKAKKKAKGGAHTGKLYAVQIGAFPSKEGAEQMSQNLKASGLKPYIVSASDGSYYKVRIGNFKNKKTAEKSAAALSKKTGLQNFVTAAQ